MKTFKKECEQRAYEFIDSFFNTLSPEMIELRICSTVAILGRACNSAHPNKHGLDIIRPNLYRVDISEHLDTTYGDSKAIDSRWNVRDTVIAHELIHVEQYIESRSRRGRAQDPHGLAFRDRLREIGGPHAACTDSTTMSLQVHLWKCDHCRYRVVSQTRWNMRRGCPNHKSFIYLVPAYMNSGMLMRDYNDRRPTPIRYVSESVLDDWLRHKVSIDAVRIASAKGVLDKLQRDKKRRESNPSSVLE